jgi:hypothetical protein
LSTGIYDVYVCVLGVPGNVGQNRSNLDVIINGVSIIDRGLTLEANEFGWQWIRLGEVTIQEGEPQQIRVNSAAKGGFLPLFQDIAAFSFQKRRNETPNDGSGPLIQRWPGHVKLEPREMRTWVASIDAASERCDVWVREYGESGRAYRIFNVQN